MGTPLSFGDYLIHTHPYVRKSPEMVCSQAYRQLDYPWWFTLVVGPVIYLSCSVVDAARLKLFAWCRIKSGAERSADAVSRLLEVLMNNL